MVQLSVFSQARQLEHHLKINLTNVRMIHDFMITERFAIVPDLPLEMDPPGACKNKRFLFHFNKQGRCRYGVVPRNAIDASETIWVDTESHYVFHYGNSWDYHENGTDFVVFYAVVWP